MPATADASSNMARGRRASRSASDSVLTAPPSLRLRLELRGLSSVKRQGDLRWVRHGTSLAKPFHQQVKPGEYKWLQLACARMAWKGLPLRSENHSFQKPRKPGKTPACQPHCGLKASRVSLRWNEEGCSAPYATLQVVYSKRIHHTMMASVLPRPPGVLQTCVTDPTRSVLLCWIWIGWSVKDLHSLKQSWFRGTYTPARPPGRPFSSIYNGVLVSFHDCWRVQCRKWKATQVSGVDRCVELDVCILKTLDPQHPSASLGPPGFQTLAASEKQRRSVKRGQPMI